MDEQMMRERIRSLEEHTDKLVAQSDALKAQLTITLAERDAEIAALRQQVAELQAWKDAVPVNDIAFLVGSTDASLGETPQSSRVVKWGNALIDDMTK